MVKSGPLSVRGAALTFTMARILLMEVVSAVKRKSIIFLLMIS